MAYIMIIDDDEDFAFAAATMMRGTGHDVQVEHAPDAALQSIQQRRPDLIVLDVMFPEDQSAGFKLSRSGHLSGIPILMLTAVNSKFPLGFSKSDIDGNWLPVADFLEKPIDIDLLQSRVETLLADAKEATS